MRSTENNQFYSEKQMLSDAICSNIIENKRFLNARWMDFMTFKLGGGYFELGLTLN